MQLHTVAGVLSWLITVKAGPPVFEDKEVTTINTNAGKLLEIKCSAKGNPQPLYKWYNQNGEQLGPNSYPPVDVKLLHTSNNTFSVLIFNETKAEYSGTYTCVAENSHGLRSKIYEVSIIEKEDEEPVITDVEFTNITDRSVSILLKGTGQFGSINVKYAEKFETLYSQLFFKDKNIFVDTLKPSGEYNFTFSASTAKSDKIIWTKNYTVVLRPGVPDVIFRSLNGGVLDVEWFHTFNDFKRKTIDQYILTYYTIQIREGNYFKPSDCRMKIEVPLCLGSHYTIANLQHKTYYQIEVQAHTSAGYGPPSKNKIYIS